MAKHYVAHKFRLKPTSEQAELLTEWCHINRFIWNHFLAKNKDQHQNTNKFVFFHEMCIALPKLKKEHDFIRQPPAHSIQNICQRLDTAIKRVWQTKFGFPHFKSKKRGDLPSIQVPQVGSHIKWTKDKINIPKLGEVRWVKHRPLAGRLVSTTTKYEGGNWWVVVLCEATKPVRLGPTDQVGIDLGLKDWVVTSDGEVFNLHPGLLVKEEKVKTEQRKLSKKQKDSSNRSKQKRKLQRAWARVRFARNDNAHKVSTAIAKQYSQVAVEDLNIKGMMKNRCLARKIAQVSWGQLVNFLSYKTEIKKVDRWYPSSKTCSRCGYKQPMPLDVRTYRCGSCGFEIDRDLNAAINIYQTTFGTKGSYACGDTNTGEVAADTSRHVSLNQEKGEVRSTSNDGSFDLEAARSLAAR